MKCNECGAELGEELVCPVCGAENAPAEAPEVEVTEEAEVVEAAEEVTPILSSEEFEKAPINKKKLSLLVVGITLALILVAVLIAVLAKPKDEPAPTVPDNSVYTEPTETQHIFVPDMSDEEAERAMATVIGHMGEAELTNGEASIYFWVSYYQFVNQLYNYYGVDPSYFGLDTSKPLKDQECQIGDEGQTWQDYFMTDAIASWADAQALALACKENGIKLDEGTQAQLDTLEDSLAESAKSNGFATAQEMLRADFGAGVSFAHYKKFAENMMLANQFYVHYQDTLDMSEQAISDFYDQHPADFQEAGIEKSNSPSSINIRHILITPEGDKVVDPETGESDYTKEQMDAAYAKAEEILEAWKAGEATEDSFAALAGEHTQDPGSAQTGGLYTDVTPGQMVVPFNDWCFAEGRQLGDTGLVITSYGVHVMYFSGVEDATPYWISVVREQYVGSTLTALAQLAADNHPYDIDMDAIVVSEVDMTGAF